MSLVQLWLCMHDCVVVIHSADAIAAVRNDDITTSATTVHATVRRNTKSQPASSVSGDSKMNVISIKLVLEGGNEQRKWQEIKNRNIPQSWLHQGQRSTWTEWLESWEGQWEIWREREVPKQKQCCRL